MAPEVAAKGLDVAELRHRHAEAPTARLHTSACPVRHSKSFEVRPGGKSNDVYRWIEHTGELELHIEAPTEQAAFIEALVAFAELLDHEGGGSESVRRELELEADEAGELLAAWLDEFVYLAEVDGFVPERVTELHLDGGRLRATVGGHRGEPRPLVKAVTRHGLALEPVGRGGWHARVVLDV
jgi:SHS2 domain-containing protein